MRVWPEGAWFGLTKRRILRGCITLFTVALLLWSTAYGYCLYKAHRARELIEQISTLKPGESTDEEALALLGPYGFQQRPTDCTPANCRYLAAVNDSLFDQFQGRKPWIDELVWRANDAAQSGWLGSIGLRFWDIDCSVAVRDNRVDSVSATALVSRGNHRWLQVGWEFMRHMPANFGNDNIYLPDDSPRAVDHFYVQSYHLHVSNGAGLGLRARVTNSATPEQRRQAFNVDLRCLTSLRACKSTCDLAPGMTRYYSGLRQQGFGGFDSPELSCNK